MKTIIPMALGVLMLSTLSGCLTTRAQLREQSTPQRPVTLSPVQEKRAQEVVRMEEYDSQFRQMNGRMDILENHMAQLNAGDADRKSMETRMRDEQDKRFKAYEEALAKLDQQLQSLSQEVKDLKARPVAAPAPAKNRDHFGAAEDAFERKDWKQAIVEYENYRKSNPKGKSYAAATLKIGMAFHELNMKDEAKAFYEEVVTKFPGSGDAKKATQRLKAMK